MKRIFLALGALALVGAFFYFDLKRFLTLAELKQRQSQLQAIFEARPVVALGAYFVFYVATTALSLPGATVLTLAGAAVLGFWPALVVVSFASSVGAALAFLTSRYLFRAGAARRLGTRMAQIDEGVKRDGVFYLLTLRLSPLFPFFLVNMALGLTAMRLPVFYVVSQLGMLPATALYVNAGTRLGQLESLSAILDWKLVVSLTALGVFPLAVNALLKFLRRPRSPGSMSL